MPLVPAAIDGTDRMSRLPKLKIAYGPPVRTDDLAGMTPRDASREATERLMKDIYELHDVL